jgi:hypothetical protein
MTRDETRRGELLAFLQRLLEEATVERIAGRGLAVRHLYEIVAHIHALAKIWGIEFSSPAMQSQAAKKSIWKWFKGLFGIKSCDDVDVTGAHVNQQGKIVEANGNVIQCPSGTHVDCDRDNNLWICSP